MISPIAQFLILFGNFLPSNKPTTPTNVPAVDNFKEAQDAYQRNDPA
jgi:hypothetical protein